MLEGGVQQTKLLGESQWGGPDLFVPNAHVQTQATISFYQDFNGLLADLPALSSVP